MSQQSRRSSTQNAEAGPSTSRRQSRAITTGDSDEESHPRQAKSTSNGKRRVAKVDEEEDAAPEDDEEDDEFGELAQPLVMPQIDEAFLNQPLKKDEAALKLNNLIKEWKDVERRVQGYLELLASSAGELQETLVDTDGDDQDALEVDCNHVVANTVSYTKCDSLSGTGSSRP